MTQFGSLSSNQKLNSSQCILRFGLKDSGVDYFSRINYNFLYEKNNVNETEVKTRKTNFSAPENGLELVLECINV